MPWTPLCWPICQDFVHITDLPDVGGGQTLEAIHLHLQQKTTSTFIMPMLLDENDECLWPKPVPPTWRLPSSVLADLGIEDTPSHSHPCTIFELRTCEVATYGGHQRRTHVYINGRNVSSWYDEATVLDLTEEDIVTFGRDTQMALDFSFLHAAHPQLYFAGKEDSIQSILEGVATRAPQSFAPWPSSPTTSFMPSALALSSTLPSVLPMFIGIPGVCRFDILVDHLDMTLHRFLTDLVGKNTSLYIQTLCPFPEAFFVEFDKGLPLTKHKFIIPPINAASTLMAQVLEALLPNSHSDEENHISLELHMDNRPLGTMHVFLERPQQVLGAQTLCWSNTKPPWKEIIASFTFHTA